MTVLAGAPALLLSRKSLAQEVVPEIEKGPFHGPFNTAAEMIAHMQSQLRKRATAKKAKRSR